MDNDFILAMLTVLFAATLLVSGLVFMDQHNRRDAAQVLRKAAVSQGHAGPAKDIATHTLLRGAASQND